jgi:hypothetical protein
MDAAIGVYIKCFDTIEKMSICMAAIVVRSTEVSKNKISLLAIRFPWACTKIMDKFISPAERVNHAIH